MKTTSIAKPFLLLTVICHLLALGCSRENSEESAIIETWGKHQAAMKSGDGIAFVDTSSNDALTYYDEVVRLARTAQRRELENAMLPQAFSALRARFTIGLDDLEGMTGRDLLIRFNSEPREPNTSTITLGDVTIQGNKAQAVFVENGVPSDDLEYFVKENGIWKMDFTPAIQRAEAKLEERREAANLGKIEFVKEQVERRLGYQVSESLWNPE